MKKIVYSMVVISLISLMITSCEEPAEVKKNPTSVVVKRVEKELFADSLEVSGNVEGKQTVRLGFMVAGKIISISKEEGQSIKKGQVLAQLDPESYQLARNIAKAKLEEIEDEYNRLTKLFEKGSVSESDYVKITSGLEQARSHFGLQEKNLKDTKLYAPVSGVLIVRGVEPGEIIDQGRPVFAIAKIDTIQVNAAVPEGELQLVKIGDTALVKIPSLSKMYTGKISLVGAVAEPTTRTFNVKIDIPNSDFVLKPGMIAEVSLRGTEATEQITLPPNAIIKDTDDTYYVYVADQKQAKAFKRKVAIGEVSENRLSVISGLNEGEWIVVGGQHKLQDGSDITVKSK